MARSYRYRGSGYADALPDSKHPRRQPVVAFTATTARPLYQPQAWQARWGKATSLQLGQVMYCVAATLSWLARRWSRLLDDVLRLGTATAILL